MRTARFRMIAPLVSSILLFVPLPIDFKLRVIADDQPDPAHPPVSRPVQVEIFENLRSGSPFELKDTQPVEAYYERAFGFVRLPTKYSANALPLDRSTPFVIRATVRKAFPAGDYEFRLRAKGAVRFQIDDDTLLTTIPQVGNTSGNDPVPPPIERKDSLLRPVPYPHQEQLATVRLDGNEHRFTLIAVIGGKGLVPTPGELSLSFGRSGEIPRLLGDPDAPLLTDEAWESYAQEQFARHRHEDTLRRRTVSAEVSAQWSEYHRSVRDWVNSRPGLEPPKVPSSIPVFNAVDRFIGARLRQTQAPPTAKAASSSLIPPSLPSDGGEGRGEEVRPEELPLSSVLSPLVPRKERKQSLMPVQPTALVSDLEFLRRLSLDTIGVIPSAEEVNAFMRDPADQRRARAIDRLLADPGWADHWVSYWQDALAENPGILKPDLNNSGPFRWWLHQSFTDNIPFDRLVAELVLMEGSIYQGAPAAFKLATLNDSPMAAKADILSQAFLGEKLSCARCHDAPDHPHKQNDTFSFAAMLEGKAVKIPVSSTVPFVEGFRKPRVDVTLKPGQEIEPHWPFAQLTKASEFSGRVPVSQQAPAPRRQVAAMIVSPENDRFAKVIVNRVWKRYIGAGLVEPVEDWHETKASHPELLDFLAREFVLSGYDLKALARLIFSSHLYQRAALPALAQVPESKDRLFAGPMRRRLTAEQLVDSLYRLTGKRFDCEELNLNPAGNRGLNEFLNLGTPRRAWEFTALMNERDRPALALPIAQSIVDVLTTFGWRQSRQNPVTVRQDAPSAMQTLLLANGIVGTRITRLSDDSTLTELALEDRALPDLVAATFLRILTRPPSEQEGRVAAEYLKPFYADRKQPGSAKRKKDPSADKRVSWANHLSAEATVIRMEEERRLRSGDAPTERLKADFRERYEDIIWSLVNSPEFALVP